MKIINKCPFKKFRVVDPTSDVDFMKLAFNKAITAWQAGEIPIGAVAVVNGDVVATAYNKVEIKMDASAHAEMQLLRKLSVSKRDWRLCDVNIYVTKEPCPMCSGSLFKHRVNKVVFGAIDKKQGCLGGKLDFNKDLSLYHKIEVLEEPLGGLCEEMLKSFFVLRRTVL